MSTKAERELRRMAERAGCVVIRSAGSMGEGDLVIAHRRRVWLVEVKETGNILADGDAVYRTRDANAYGLQQAEAMVDVEIRAPIIIAGWAVRRKGKLNPTQHRWRWYPNNHILNGNEILRHSEGHPLPFPTQAKPPEAPP